MTRVQRVVIAGSRGLRIPILGITTAMEELVAKYYSSCRVDIEVVSGCCADSPDKDGEAWAAEHGIPINEFPAWWDTQGKSAGMLRNARMAEYADAGIVFWDGESRGAKNMIDQLRSRRKPVEVWRSDLGPGFRRDVP